jgi:hypothetical protein
LTEEDLIPLEAARNVADPYDCPRALHGPSISPLMSRGGVRLRV